MTKKFRVILGLIMSVLPLSHSRAEDPIRIGIGAGMNLGTFRFAHDPFGAHRSLSQSPNKGLYLTGFLESRISNLSYITYRLAYVQEGTHMESIDFYAQSNGWYSDYVPDGSMHIEAEYLELSTLCMVKFGSDAIKVCPNIGPHIALHLSSQSTYEFSSQGGEPRTIIVNLQHSAGPINIAVDLGMTVEFRLSEQASMQLNSSYSIGLTDFGGVYGMPPGNAATRGTRVFVTMSYAP